MGLLSRVNHLMNEKFLVSFCLSPGSKLPFGTYITVYLILDIGLVIDCMYIIFLARESIIFAYLLFLDDFRPDSQNLVRTLKLLCFYPR